MTEIPQEIAWWKTPTALTVWTLGTGALGALATMVLARRTEREGWKEFPMAPVLGAVLAASTLNLILAYTIKGRK